MKKLVRRLVLRLYWLAQELREKYDPCDICHEEMSDSECPCGRRVCGECQDFGIYTDEVCCDTCAKEIREGWEKCPKHEFDEPYENEDGRMVKECSHCSYTTYAVGTSAN